VLHTAVINGQLESLKLMLSLVDKSGQHEILDEANKSGVPLLQLAVQAGQPEVVRLLLASRVSPDCRDGDGESAVHAAVREDSADMLEQLLLAGADPNLPSHLGKFPLHVAVERNLLPLVKLMADHGVDMEARDQVAGRTALHLAVDRQLEEMVRYLVKEAKVELAREDYSGMEALNFAESSRNQNIFRLVRHGIKKQNK
jgi:NF-kappa-B inhibitor alpha